MNKQRRRFLRAASMGGLAYALARTPGTVMAQSMGITGFSDYKAMVCLFLFGGNDSWNMVVPTNDTAYQDYYVARGGGTTASLALDKNSLLPITPQTALPNGLTLGLHPRMSGVQSLFQSGNCAIVANIGPLLEPTSKMQYLDKSVSLPPQLFSHNDQQDQWHSLRGNALLKSGWAGRIADVLNTQLGNQQMPLNISLSGQTLFQAGNMASPYVMGASGAETFDGFGSSGVSLGRRQTVESIIQAEYPTVYQRGFAGVQQGAIRYADLVNTTLAASRNFTSLSDTDDTLSPLATQLRTVAKMIDRRESLGMSRQIFFVTMGGFDTHDEQNENQPELLGAVSDALKRFNDAMTEINLQDKVTSFTHSDFGRTLSSNGDGSDHAWGGVQLVVGGAVKGQAIYGTYPELRLDSDLDLGGGRFIPTTSADQYVATLAKWFGVDDAYLEEIAPNLKKFTLKDLGFFR